MKDLSSGAAKTGVRIDPNVHALKQKEALEKSKSLKQEREDADAQEATFKPKSFTKHSSKATITGSSVISGQLSGHSHSHNTKSVVEKQLRSGNVMEKPLPATLARLGIENMPNNNSNPGSESAVVDSLAAAMKTTNAPRSPLKAQSANISSNVNASNGVYVPQSPVELGLRKMPRARPGEVEEAFQKSLRSTPPPATGISTTTAGGSGTGFAYDLSAVGMAQTGTTPTPTKARVPLRDRPTPGSAESRRTPGSQGRPRSRLATPSESPITPSATTNTTAGGSTGGAAIDTSAGAGAGAYVTPSKNSRGLTPTGTTPTAATAAAVGSTTPRSAAPSSAGKARICGSLIPHPVPSPTGTPTAAAAATISPTAPAAGMLGSSSSPALMRVSVSAGSPRHSNVGPESPTKSSQSPLANPRTRLALLKKKMKKRESSNAAAAIANTSDTGANADDTRAPAAAPVPGVMDSNGNLCLNGEYSGSDAVHGTKFSLNFRKNRRDSEGVILPAALKGAGRKGRRHRDEEADIDPVTGEFCAAGSFSAAATSGTGAASGGSANNDKNSAVVASAGLRRRRSLPLPATTAAASPPAAISSTVDKSEHLVSFEAAADMPGAFADNNGDAAAAPEQMTCPTCARKFNKTAGERHVKICKSVFVEKPTKVFDSAAMRIEKIAENAPEIGDLLRRSNSSISIKGGVDSSVEGLPKRVKKDRGRSRSSTGSSIDSTATDSDTGSITGGGAAAPPSAKQPKWKRDSEALRKAMGKRSGTGAGAGGGDIGRGAIAIPAADSCVDGAAVGVGAGAGTETSTSSPLNEETNFVQEIDPSLVQCPHCERRFNEKAADRHIPQCLDIKARPKTLLKKTGVACVSKALPAKKKLVGRII